MSHFMKAKKKTQPLILTQQTELWFNSCSAQSMRNTTVHFPHLWHCNIRYKVLVCRHVSQLLGGRLQGFMDKSSCGFDKGFRAALILQLSKQHKKRRHTGSLGRVCCYVSSGPFWSKHPWRGSSSMMPHLQYGVNTARWMNIKWFLHFFAVVFNTQETRQYPLSSFTHSLQVVGALLSSILLVPDQPGLPLSL